MQILLTAYEIIRTSYLCSPTIATLQIETATEVP